MTTTGTAKPRQTKTPQQRAQEEVAVLERRAKRIGDQLTQARADVRALEISSEEVRELLAHARKHPALKPPATPSTTTGATA